MPERREKSRIRIEEQQPQAEYAEVESRAEQVEAGLEWLAEAGWPESGQMSWGFMRIEITKNISPVFLLVAGVDASLLPYAGREWVRRVT